MICPLCLETVIEHYYHDNRRDYWQCIHCHLVFVKPQDFLSPFDEKAIYDKHKNLSDDIGYQTFLNKLLIPLSQKIKPPAFGLDFGSGPGPTVSKMMKKKGYKMVDFDIYYANNPVLLKQSFDFITCTEVIEHLYYPHQELTKLHEILKINGFLGIMTKRLINHEKFMTWHYKNDPTHVCFYSDSTFEYIANNWGFKIEFINSDTVILNKT
jgi:ubiquinone/menaquinone biosynthesis C-methylase UbiE